MAAPTSTVQRLKKTLANGEPSTHGAKPTDRSRLPSDSRTVAGDLITLEHR